MTPTPREKADEILCDIIQSGANKVSLFDAKKIGIVVVNQILKSKPMEPRTYTSTDGYYEEVKKEILNM